MSTTTAREAEIARSSLRELRGGLVGPTARSLLRLTPAPPQGPTAIRAAIATAVPVAVGALWGDVALGLVASLGAFTAMYGGELTGRRQSVAVAATAVTIAIASAAGALTAGHPWIAVAVVAAWTAAITVVWDVAGFGPPGAQLLVLVCASATGLPPGHVPRTAAVVLAVGVLAWALDALARARSAPRDAAPAAVAGRLALPASPTVFMAVRAGAAVLIAGAVANLVGITHPVWPMAAAAGVLGQGSYAMIATQRALHRTAGALGGVGLASGVVALHPRGLLLAPVLAALQALTQVTVLRNYALAMVFITPISLVLTDAVGPPQAVMSLAGVWVGGTIIGAASALAMGQVAWPGWAVHHLRAAIARAQLATSAVRDELQRTGGVDPLGAPARELSRRLAQLELVALRTNEERRSVRRAVAPLEPQATAVQRAARELLAGA